jgi:hypothetical protein
MLAHAVSWPFSSPAGAVYLGGHAVLSCGELAGLAGDTAAVTSALGLAAAVRAPATLGIWPARCANCPAGQR